MSKRRTIDLTPEDKKVLTLLESHPFTALSQRHKKRAERLSRSHTIERYTVSINPAIYKYLPGTRQLCLIMIDTMLVPAEKRIQDYFKGSPFLERMTIYSTFGEIAFVGFIVATADEVVRLAEEIFDAVHKGPGAIRQDKDCNLRKGIRLYSVANALVLCGEKLPPLTDAQPNESHLIELSKAVEDASTFTMKNRALARLRGQGYIGPFTVQVDPVGVGRFVVLIPLFLAQEGDLQSDILSDRTLMKKVRHMYRVYIMPNWGDEYYQYMSYFLICEFDGLNTDYADWYQRLIEKITRANINEFAIRTRIHEAIMPISDIPRMQETAARYAVSRKEGLVLGRALVPAGPGKGPEIALSLRALQKHLIVMGLSRTGKSTTLTRIAAEARRLGLGVLFVDGKGDLIADDGTIMSSTVRALAPAVIDAKEVIRSSNVLQAHKDRMALLSVRGLEHEKYGVLFGEVLKQLDAMPTVSKPGEPVTFIHRLIILDEVETLVGDDAGLFESLERLLTQAASKGNCIIPVLHHYPKERRRLIERCENRIVHKLESDANEVQTLLAGADRKDALLFDIKATLPTLGHGMVFVSFLDAELKRLPAMHVEITNPAHD